MEMAACDTSPTVMLRAWMPSIRPPRAALFLMRSAMFKVGLFISQSWANTLRTPPDISLPTVTPPCPFFMWQPRITMFSAGTFTRRPSSLRPDLMAMQSSPVLKKQFSISTSEHDSGSHPSVFGPELLIYRSLTVTFLQRHGVTCHMGEFSRRTPSIRMFLERYG